MSGQAVPWMDKDEHVLKLGESFQKRPRSAYHTIRYDFKPASIDTSCEGTLEVGKKDEVMITLPNVEGSTPPVTVFKGSKRLLQKECVLIVNRETGEFRLEKLSSNIPVKKTRLESGTKAQSVGGRVGSGPVPVQGQGQSQGRSATKASTGQKMSPVKDKPSPDLPLEDIEKELRADASVIEQMSSSSSSDSGNSSSSDSSSSDSETPNQQSPAPAPATVTPSAQAPAPPATLSPASQHNGTARAKPDCSGYINTLRNDLQLSESGSDSE